MEEQLYFIVWSILSDILNVRLRSISLHITVTLCIHALRPAYLLFFIIPKKVKNIEQPVVQRTEEQKRCRLTERKEKRRFKA